MTHNLWHISIKKYERTYGISFYAVFKRTVGSRLHGFKDKFIKEHHRTADIHIRYMYLSLNRTCEN